MKPSTLVSVLLSLAYSHHQATAAPTCKTPSATGVAAPAGLALSELPVALATGETAEAAATSAADVLPEAAAPSAEAEAEGEDTVYATVTEEVLVTLQAEKPKVTVTRTLHRTRTITPGENVAEPTAPIIAPAETDEIIPISSTIDREATLPVEPTGVVLEGAEPSTIGVNLAADPSAAPTPTEAPAPAETMEGGNAEGSSIDPAVVTVLSTTEVPVVTDITTEGATPSATDSASAEPSATPSAGAGMGCNATSTGVAGSGKAGLSWNKDSGSCSNDFLQADSKVSWGWNWGYNQDVVSPYIEFVPTLFSPGDYEAMIVAASISWPESTKSLISLYEPQLDMRGNLTVAEAVAVQQKLSNETVLSEMKIGGPVMSQDLSGTMDAAKGWYSNFTASCEGCKVDFLPVAFYSNNVDQTIGSLSDWYNTFGAITGKKIWLVETNCRDLASGTPCSTEEAAHYAHILLQWAEMTGWIEKYAWFDTFTTDASDNGNGNGLVTSTGHLSDLGHYYAYGS